MTLVELIERADENHNRFVRRERESGCSRLPDPAMSTHVHETMLRDGPEDPDWARDLIRLLPSSSKERVTTFKRAVTNTVSSHWPSGIPNWSTM